MTVQSSFHTCPNEINLLCKLGNIVFFVDVGVSEDERGKWPFATESTEDESGKRTDVGGSSK